MSLTISVEKIVEESDNPLLVIAEGWERITLGEIADILNGFAFKSKYFNRDEGITLIRIRDVGSNASATLYAGEYDANYIVEDGDLLIGMDGDFKSARWHGPKGLLNQRVCKVMLQTDNYEPKLLDYVLPGYLDAIHAHTSSVTVKHLSSKTVTEIPLPLPPLPEQRRIVEKIEELFSDLDAGVAALRQVRKQLQRYRQAVLKAAVEGTLTEAWRAQHGPDREDASVLLKRILEERRSTWEAEQLAKYEAKGKTPPKDWQQRYKEPAAPDTADLPDLPNGWVWVSLDQLLIESLSNGRSVRTDERGFPVLRLTCLQAGRIALQERKNGAWTAEEAKPYLVEKGDYFVSRGNGSLKLVGRGGLVEQTPDPVAYPDTMIRIRVNEKRYDPRLLRLVWASSIVRKHIESSARTTAGIYKINQYHLRNTFLPLPPVEEQEAIIDTVEERLTVADVAEKAVEHEMKRAERLRQSILKRAFEGTLVPQDPGDEPASVLLERIRSAKKRPKAQASERTKPGTPPKASPQQTLDL